MCRKVVSDKALEVGYRMGRGEVEKFAKATASVMSFFLHGALQSQRYDEDFVVSTMIPSIRKKSDPSLVARYKDVVQLNVPPTVRRCSLTPKYIKQALAGLDYNAQIAKGKAHPNEKLGDSFAVTNILTIEDNEEGPCTTWEIPSSPDFIPGSPVIASPSQQPLSHSGDFDVTCISEAQKEYLGEVAREIVTDVSKNLNGAVQLDLCGIDAVSSH